MSVTLWLPDNNTVDSSIFEVKAGEAVSLFATGLEQYKYRTSALEPMGPQAICVARLILAPVVEEVSCLVGPPISLCECNERYETTYRSQLTVKDEEIVASGCEVWQLTACNNFRILAVPGIYRLHLNDETAIGKVQVYAEQLNVQDLPQQTADLFFS